MTDGPNYRFHKKPRFSANHMAEYLCATSTLQRNAVIRDAKFPRKPSVVSYTQAKPSICNFLKSNSGDFSHFTVTLEKLAAKAARETGYARDEALRCHAAIEAFKEAFKSSRSKKYEFTPGPVDVAMSLEDVLINVRMEAGLIDRSEEPVVGGGCVLYLSASAATRKNIEKRRKYVAALVHWGLEVNGGQIEPTPRLCMSFDVFGGVVEKAPASFGKLRENMRQSCREVAQKWDGIAPPAGYDGPDWR